MSYAGAKAPPGRQESFPEDATSRAGLSFGPPRYFVPVCVLTPWGFIGGPNGYTEVPAEDVPDGPIVIEVTDD